MRFLKKIKNQSGQGMTEYIIIVALIAIAAIAAFTYFGSTVRTQTASMTEELAGQDPSKAKTELGKAVKGSEGEMKAKGLQDYADGAKAGK